MEISTRTEDGELVLCASSIYNQKFYLNKEFSKLPDEIKDELHAMCERLHRRSEEYLCWCLTTPAI